MTTPHRITTAIVVAFGLAVSAGPALAMQTDLTPNGSEVPAGSPSVRGQTPPSPTPAIVRISVPGAGFDWGDAGIGAARGFALSMIGISGALVVSQRRTGRSETAPSS